MRIEERFNKRAAELVEVQPPTIQTGVELALGIKLTFYQLPGDDNDGRTLAMHMTPREALTMAQRLIETVNDLMLKDWQS